MTQTQIRTGQLAGRTGALFLNAMALFTVTVLIGIVNGLDLVEFSHDQLLTHVHAGTLGWITLSVFGAALLMFSQNRTLSEGELRRASSTAMLSAVLITLYAAAFFLGNTTIRVIVGTLTLAAIGAFYGWALSSRGRVEMTIPHLAMLAALTSLLIGAILGVLLGLQTAGVDISTRLFAGHPATMVIGYLLLAGMAITEWRLVGTPKPIATDKAGVIQVALLFLGGITLMLGILLDVFPLLTLNVPCEVIGVGIFLVRMRKQLAGAGWSSAGSTRLFAASALFLVANVVLLAYLIVNYADDFESVPSWLLFALDHSVFIGVMTNALFGLIETWSGAESEETWVNHVAFYGVNAGLIGFVAGLMTQSDALKHIFAPIMGVSILVTMAVFSVRLLSGGGRRMAAAA
ncbi:MAG: hypothetical protein H0T12_04455 [Actinobacteria bacterium]|nr:hypothetical protein [Actinomycetota bacterium]